MAVTMPREKWTDERLDGLKKEVDRGDRLTAETKAEMRKRCERIEARMDGQVGQLRESLFNLQQLLYWCAVLIVVALILSKA